MRCCEGREERERQKFYLHFVGMKLSLRYFAQTFFKRILFFVKTFNFCHLRPKRPIKDFFVFQTFGRNLAKFRRSSLSKTTVYLSLDISQTKHRQSNFQIASTAQENLSRILPQLDPFLDLIKISWQEPETLISFLFKNPSRQPD